MAAVLWGSPTQDRTLVKTPALTTEARALLAVQCRGAHLAHVDVCAAGSLDGVCLVLYWTL